MDASRRLAAAQRTFVPPPALEQSRPRSVALTAAGKCLVVLAVGLFAGAIVAGVGLGVTARRSTPPWLPFPVAAGLAALGGLCLWAPHRQRRLLSEGRAAPAIVTAHKNQQTTHGSNHTMTYEFLLLNGAVRTGTSGTSNKPPAVGSVICVIYDPEVPARHKVYPFSLVTPAT